MAELLDGFVSLLSGMHGGLAPELLKETYYARGLNVSSRDGLVHTRPKFSLEYTLLGSSFMGAAAWSLKTGDKIVYVMAGIIYSVDVSTWTTTALGSFFSTTGRCYFCQLDRYMVIQDGVWPAQALEEVGGVPTVVSGHNIPVGTAMTYVHGRLHMVPKYVPGTSEPGDPYFISGDMLLPNDPKNVLQFTETDYWAEGGAHGIPQELGNVTGLHPFRNAATGTGFGGLVVFGKHGCSAFDMSLPRSKWNTMSLSQVLFSGAGIGTVSPFSILTLNDDMVYRGIDGIRFVRYTKTAVAGSGGALSCVPSSNEVRPFMDNEDSDSLPYVSTALADNRMFMTAGGKWSSSSDIFTSLIVLDMAAIYGMSGAPSPAYDGIWTGVNPRQVLTITRDNKQVLMVISEGNKMYSLADNVYTDPGDSRPLCRLYTKVMYFPNDRLSLKELKYLEFWLSGLYHDVDITVHYRPEGFPLWSKMGEATIHSLGSTYAQRRRKVRVPLSDSAKTYDPETKESLYRSTGFQFCIEWSGHLQLDTVRMAAEGPIPETVKLACQDKDGFATLSTSSTLYELDDYTYNIEA